jgi:hypothetical protein
MNMNQTPAQPSSGAILRRTAKCTPFGDGNRLQDDCAHSPKANREPNVVGNIKRFSFDFGIHRSQASARR